MDWVGRADRLSDVAFRALARIKAECSRAGGSVDEAALLRLSGTGRAWGGVRAVVAPFFKIENGRWFDPEFEGASGGANAIASIDGGRPSVVGSVRGGFQREKKSAPKSAPPLVLITPQGTVSPLQKNHTTPISGIEG